MQPEMLNDDFYMKLAIQMAAGTVGQTGINPAVGCVIVKEGRIIGMGAHLQRGEPHAEINALQMAGDKAEGSTVYVTLEPCSHQGRTPPCSDRLIREKVARVVVACTDPNPLVAGRGLEKLRQAGIDTSVGCMEAEAQDLNEAFNKYIRTKLPFVSLKTASTLDGKIASHTGDSRWITGAESRAYVHMLRHRHQGIMVGIETILADDPELNVRTAVPGLHPIPIIVDSALRLPLAARVLGRPGLIVLTTERASKERIRELEDKGAEVWVTGSGPRVDLQEGMRRLGEREIGSVLLEGGGRLNGAMLELGLIDKCYLFYAPKIIGGAASPGNFQFAGFERMKEALPLTNLSVQTFGDDICVIGYPDYGRSSV